jgi:hypothetical protein
LHHMLYALQIFLRYFIHQGSTFSADYFLSQDSLHKLASTSITVKCLLLSWLGNSFRCYSLLSHVVSMVSFYFAAKVHLQMPCCSLSIWYVVVLHYTSWMPVRCYGLLIFSRYTDGRLSLTIGYVLIKFSCVGAASEHGAGFELLYSLTMTIQDVST